METKSKQRFICFKPIEPYFTALLKAKFESLRDVVNNRNNWYRIFNYIPAGELVRLNPRILY